MPELKQFIPQSASDEEFMARNRFHNVFRAEERPEDPPMPLERSKRNALAWQHFEDTRIEVWDLWEAGEIVAELFAPIDYHESNQHAMDAMIRVQANHRGQGYAKLLARKVLTLAQDHERRLILFFTTSRIPAGEGFAAYLKAERGLEERISQLDLSKVDRSLIQSWLSQAPSKAKDFELDFWGNVFPEDELEAIASLRNVMNTAPRDDLELEDHLITPKQIRESEAYAAEQGRERWEAFVRHKESRELAGYSSTYWFPENPRVLDQGATAVLPKFRGYGLGKWLKAAMIERVLKERPEVAFIRTGNAYSNAPMLAINNALGFEPFFAQTIWQLPRDTLAAYLTH